MREAFADIVVDISGGKLDRTFQYHIPEQWISLVQPGTLVEVPFGNGKRHVRGYVIGLSQEAKIDPKRIRDIANVPEEPLTIESRLIELAWWMKERYGSTMLQALRTVLPMKQKVKEKKNRIISLQVEREEARRLCEECEKKHQTARHRLLQALLDCEDGLDYTQACRQLKLTATTLRALEEKKVITIREETLNRFPELPDYQRDSMGALSEEQEATIAGVLSEKMLGGRPCLIHGITGSGKTRVYMELVEHMQKEGRETILLLPEIALTYQAVWQFRQRFGSRAAIMHSKMSQGERWDAFRAAKEGKISVMIGPRSALFTPFAHLGMIIVDEEHEPSYNSEGMPRYHTVETARKRCQLEKAQLVLGSATPSIESYMKGREGSYRLLSMKHRFGNGSLPKTEIVDMRSELREGNSSMLSRRLTDEIAKRLERKEQSILFLNRRGYAGFIVCRNCGYVAKCPHCDVSLSQHRDGSLRCHYCGYRRGPISVCPDCGSGFIGGFRAGTQQVEEVLEATFPKARIARMDLDTTRNKDGHTRILTAFSKGEADILVGTQMVIKGHDFPKVTLVGVLAADLSLYADNYQAAERTFQMLVQAAGRAGRGNQPGLALIQTYSPDHYSIQAAASQDYPLFFEKEISYRMLMGYPPVGGMLAVLGSGDSEIQLEMAMQYIKKYTLHIGKDSRTVLIGPADAAVAKIQDRYRKVLYIKNENREELLRQMKMIQRYIEINSGFDQLVIQFDLD